MSLRRVLRARVNMAVLSGKPVTQSSSPARKSRQNEYESPRFQDSTRYDDEPAPTEDDMISKLFLLT
jgi:hypothetical protein